MKLPRWGTRRVTLRVKRLSLTLSLRRLTAICVVCLGVIAAWIVLGTSVCGVHELRIEGSERVNVEQIRARADVESGAPLARLNTATIADRIEELPQIRYVEVFRSWPRTLRVRVTERQALAYAPVTEGGGEGYYLLDEVGVAFEKAAEPPALPQVRLDIEKTPRSHIAAAVHVADAVSGELEAATQYVSAESPEQIQLHLHDERVIHWGDTSRSEKKARVATVLLSRGGKEIDISAPDVVTVR